MVKKAKIAIITGAGGGIGRGIAVGLAAAGWTTVINDIGDKKPANETLRLVRKAGSDGLIVTADITSAADRSKLLDAAIKKYGRVDLLVNNAGIAPRVRRDMLEITESSLGEVMAVNAVGPYFLSQLVAKKMIQLIKKKVIKSAVIVNIGSISAYTSSPSRAEYCISKAALAMSTLLYADRLAAEGINVYEVRPGIIRTPMTEAVKGKYDKLIAGGVTPIKRWGRPEDVARAVVAIAEGCLPFSTGQVIDVDGGFHIQRL
ncbi:MAG: 3-ketoacyl-ACP reductase [Dehalococcoidia bacterium]|jgi:NAD(P)-dependent dehydrogenase (short-subunit alcohol dehydrogenase family)